MPMILGSFFQQVYNMADSIIVGQFVGSSALAAVGACAALTNVFHLCGAGSRCRRRCARKPLFRRQRIRQNENHRINLPAQLFRSEHRSRSLWLWLFPRDDERTANSCRHTGGGGAVSEGLFRRLSVPVHVQYSLNDVHLHRRIKNPARTADLLVRPQYPHGSLDGSRSRSRRVRRGACDTDRAGHFRCAVALDLPSANAALQERFSPV